jgi:hypothetical protein
MKEFNVILRMQYSIVVEADNEAEAKEQALSEFEDFNWNGGEPLIVGVEEVKP